MQSFTLFKGAVLTKAKDRVLPSWVLKIGLLAAEIYDMGPMAHVSLEAAKVLCKSNYGIKNYEIACERRCLTKIHNFFKLYVTSLSCQFGSFWTSFCSQKNSWKMISIENFTSCSQNFVNYTNEYKMIIYIYFLSISFINLTDK